MSLKKLLRKYVGFCDTKSKGLNEEKKKKKPKRKSPWKAMEKRLARTGIYADIETDDDC